MHELSTCKRIISQIEKIAKEHQKLKVKLVQLSIGELARVDSKELVELFPIAAKETIAQDAELQIKNTPIKVQCNYCHKSSEVTASDLSCRYCQSQETSLTDGTDMLISHIDFSEET